MKLIASKLKATLERSARARTAGMNCRSTYSFQTWKVVTKKSKTPASAVAWSSSFACEPPFSPVMSTSVMAVASG